MEKAPQEGILKKIAHISREVSALRIPVFAANACYFMVLSVFPSLLLLLGLLRYVHLDVVRLEELLRDLLPSILLQPMGKLIQKAANNTSGAALSLSAVTAMWSASRGIYGLLTGLNAIYDVKESRGYLRARLLCVFYTFVFLIMLLLTLSLHVFSAPLFDLLGKTQIPIFSYLMNAVNTRFLLLISVQVVVFLAMFCFLPNRHSKLLESLPGALMATLGWQMFSNIYSLYVERFTGLSSVYGSVYAVALCMVWLYCCVCIMFYGGVLNQLLAGRWHRGNMDNL